MDIRRSQLMMVSQEANDFFGNSGFSFCADHSLQALLRAIVLDKLGIDEYEKSNDPGLVLISKYRTSSVRDVETVVNELNGFWNGSILLVEKLSGIDECREVFAKQESEWETFDTVNKYLSQTLNSIVYINKENKRVIAIVDKKLTHDWFQSFESMLLHILPWYYPSKSDEDIAFFKQLAINKKDKNNVANAERALIEYTNKVAKKVDFAGRRLHKILDGIADNARMEEIRRLKDQIDNYVGNIQNLETRMSDLYRALDHDTLVLSNLEKAEPIKDDTWFNFFHQHKNVHVLDYSNNTLHYYVEDTLEYYDADELSTTIANERSWANECGPNFLKAVKALLIEKRGCIKVTASFVLSGLKLVQPVRGSNGNENGSMPNPHIYYFGCSGGNDQYYSKYAKSGDWELAVEQSISATKNWNVGDSAVSRKMMSWLNAYDGVPCIYYNNGDPIDRVTPDMPIISFRQFREKLIEAEKRANAAAQKESEEANNG